VPAKTLVKPVVLPNEALIELEKTQDQVAKLRAQDLIEIIKNSEEKSKK
jgi:hypothetical protein